MSFLTALGFFVGQFIFGILPFSLLYLFSDILRFFLQNIFQYRRSIVKENLTKAFPDKSEIEIKRLEKKVYLNLSDVLVEGLKSFLMTKRQIIKRHKVINLDILDKYIKSGQSLIGVTAHYGNWEWGSLSSSLQIDAHVVAFYKKLKNSYVDRFVRRSRMKFGTTLASIVNTAESFSKYAESKTVFIMAADQSTIKRNLKISYWYNFLGRETAFLHGPEKYARLYNLPVVYIDIQRIKRGFYELELSVLVDNPSELPEGEITRLYAQKLEDVIRKKPENWLWSHRRWRFTR